MSERCATKSHCRSSFPLYPRGPRSSPGYVVPGHLHLIGLIRPTRRLIPISLLQLIRNVFASLILSSQLPATGSGLSLLLLLDMSSSSTPENLLSALVQFPSSTALAFAPFE